MGTLGRYLQEARQARGLDLRDAAQQTRISAHFLKALEEENFSKLPGEVFVKGFLKSYAKFLRLNESEVMMKYAELGQKPSPPVVPGPAEQPEAAAGEQKRPAKIPIEPLIWGAAIVLILALFLFTALPERQPKEPRQAAPPTGLTGLATSPVSTATATTQKLYLEVVALENTWLLVRTDTSPQKKAVLNKGESLIWSADERFLLSYANAGAVKLLLNGQERTVNEPKNVPIRDMTITASGIVDRRIQAERPRPAKPPPAAPVKPVPQVKPSETLRGSQQAPPPTPQRQPQPQQLPQPLAPAPQNQPWGPSPNPAQ